MRTMTSLAIVGIMISMACSAEAATNVKNSTKNSVSTISAPTSRSRSSGFRFSRLTPKIALMSSNADGDVAANDSRNGLHVSALAEIATPARSLAIESGLIYEQMGFSNKTELENDTIYVGGRMNYLKVPAYAKYYLPMTSAAQVFVKGGPSIGFLVSKTQFEEKKGQTSEVEVKSEDVNSIQFSAEIGAGVLIPVGQNDILLEWAYTRALNRVNARGIQDIYNTAFSLGLGMSFNM